jgi:hypothetical protein
MPVRRADNLTTFMCRLYGNSRSLNLLEPQGPVQACSGKAFRLYVSFSYLLSLESVYPLCVSFDVTVFVITSGQCAYRCVIEMSEGREQFGKPRRKW